MTLASRLKSTVVSTGRSLLGATLGFGLAAVVAFQPAQALAGVALISPAVVAAPVAAAEAGPALWVIRDADSTIYLFGTVHVLRPQTIWRWTEVEDAFDSADQIWFEISNPDDQAAMIPLVQQHGISPDRPLNGLLTAAENTRLTEAANAVGVPPAQMNIFRPWLAGLTLSVAPLVKAGYDPQSGVEQVLKARAVAADKPIHGFETIDEQVRILADMSEAQQLAFLRGVLEGYEDAAVEIDGLVNAWSSGNVRSVERYAVTEMRRDEPAIYRALLADRNTNWAGQIQTLLNGSGTAFIAVGAAHLAGPDSVQVILARRGVRAERIH